MLVISLRVYVPGACKHSTSFSVCVDLHPLPSKGASVAFLATQGKMRMRKVGGGVGGRCGG